MSRHTISYSELGSLRRCGLKHQLSYVERWTKAQKPDSALAKGSAWHLVMETHYTILRQVRGMSQEDQLKVARDAVDQVMLSMPTDLADLIEWMYSGYVRLYGADMNWDILGIEHKASATLLTPSGAKSSYVLKFVIDLVVRDRRTGKITIIDHKSGKDLPKALALALDDQFGLYPWGLRQLGRDVSHLTWNAARTLRLEADKASPGATSLEERFKRVPLLRTKAELDTVAQEAYLSASSGYSALARYKKLGVDAPRTTDIRSCGWSCDFYDACIQGRRGRDLRTMLKDQGFAVDRSRH